jgi:hypothetical protein
VPSRQLQGQLQTQYCVDIGDYIMNKHSIKIKGKLRKVLEQKHNNAEKQINN